MKIKISLDIKDAELVAQILHTRHLDMTDEQYKRALQIGNEIARQLINIRRANQIYQKIR